MMAPFRISSGYSQARSTIGHVCVSGDPRSVTVDTHPCSACFIEAHVAAKPSTTRSAAGRDGTPRTIVVRPRSSKRPSLALPPMIIGRSCRGRVDWRCLHATIAPLADPVKWPIHVSVANLFGHTERRQTDWPVAAKTRFCRDTVERNRSGCDLADDHRVLSLSSKVAVFSFPNRSFFLGQRYLVTVPTCCTRRAIAATIRLVVTYPLARWHLVTETKMEEIATSKHRQCDLGTPRPEKGESLPPGTTLPDAQRKTRACRPARIPTRRSPDPSTRQPGMPRRLSAMRRSWSQPQQPSSPVAVTSTIPPARQRCRPSGRPPVAR